MFLILEWGMFAVLVALSAIGAPLVFLLYAILPRDEYVRMMAGHPPAMPPICGLVTLALVGLWLHQRRYR